MPLLGANVTDRESLLLLHLGLWTCHQYVGDIAAAIFSAYILRSGMDWRWCIVVPAVLPLTMACQSPTWNASCMKGNRAHM